MNVRKLSRRDFLKATGASSGILVLGVCVPGMRSGPLAATPSTAFEPNVFVAFQPDGSVTITVSRAEMGQGVRTALPRIVADELEADLARVKLVQAVGDPKYGDQNTDGSQSVRLMYTPLREAGAAARNMLEQAAALSWGVPLEQVHARHHGVEHATTGRRLDYAELLEKAATLSVPENPELKPASEYRYIGKPARGVDNEAIVTGKASYGIDVRLPGMKYACVARAPVFDARIRAYKIEAALAVPGVSACCHIPFSPHLRNMRPEEGVAVVADSSWAAMHGRDALQIDWDLGKNANYNTADYRETLKASVAKPGKVHLARGDASAALAGEGILVEAMYETPMLAHAPMEPPVATAWVKDNGDCELWVPAQDSQDTRSQVAEWLEIDPSRVRVNITLLGGGVGRKSQIDFVLEAVEVSRQVKAPVKLQWTREDDIRNCYFHAEAVQSMHARLGEDGLPSAWLMRSAYPSIDWLYEPGQDEPRPWEVGMGLTNMPFDVPNLSVEGCKAPIPIRIGWLRSVCNVWHGFAINSFVDEMAEAAGQDPAQYRLKLLGEDRIFPAPNEPQPAGYDFNGTTVDTGRYRRVLELALSKTDWGKPLPEGHFRGLAVHNSFYSYTATVVEITLDDNDGFKVISVDTAVDCGRVVNPEGVQQQVEGSAIFGLTLAMYGELTAREGKVEQSNFHNYRIMRINEAPAKIRAHIVDSDHPPSGVGEPPTPIIAPALAAALHAASGQRFRKLPLLKAWQDWRKAQG
jgi:isoquinoline 1-oxidoreductase beta subunit